MDTSGDREMKGYSRNTETESLSHFTLEGQWLALLVKNDGHTSCNCHLKRLK